MHRATLLIIATAFGFATAPAAPSIAAPNQTPQDGKIIECQLLGGTVIPQPPGSAITACCYDGADGGPAGCWICDANGNDCTFDESYRRPPGLPAFEPGFGELAPAGVVTTPPPPQPGWWPMTVAPLATWR